MTVMAKPRNSVLYLFDPLQQSPSTPRRDSSPELGSSDKENDLSQGDVTLFFNRMYAAPKLQAAQPHTPNGKLIDFGDTPAQDRLWDDAEHDGSDADEEQSENEADNLAATAAPTRTPLADLDVEDTPRPQQDARRPLQAPVFASATSPSHKEPLRALFAAPQGSPLAEVINSITFSALTVSEDATPSAERPPPFEEVQEDGRAPSPFPEINICAPETPVVPQFDVDHSAEPMVTSEARLRPPSTLTQLSPDDPRRTSVDLYSSFHLHMQSDDMSFDLLNDKISFLGNGQDSFWAGGEDTMFDFDEENRAPATRPTKDKPILAEAPPLEETPRVFSPPRATTQLIDVPVLNSPITTAMRVPLPMSPPPSTPSPRITPPHVLPQLIPAPPSPPTSPVSLDEPSLLLESEPLPPSVPALRITKKTFKVTGRPGSAPSPTAATPVTTPASQSTEKSAVDVKKPSPTTGKAPLVVAPAPVSVPQPQHPRPNYRGVQRPPASMLAAGVVIGLPPQGTSHNTSASTSSNSSAGSSASRATRPQDGSRFATAGIQRPTMASKDRTTQRSATALPARPAKVPSSTSGITRAASASAAVPKLNPGVSGLRPPSRIAAPGSGAGSTLPRPASRLPGPSASGLSRQASTGASSGIGRPRAVTAPRPPTGGRF